VKIKGRAWCYGDNVETGWIVQGKYLKINDLKELSTHAMEGIDPQFVSKVRPGDVLVAGKNFGCGSSRETAPAVLKEVGIKAIVACSFGRIFYRNAVNLGISLVESQETSLIKDGEVIEIDSEKGEIELVTSGRKIKGSRLPDFMISIVEAGGLVPFKRKQQREKAR
jgi:3-isopropylmalate dehydratase small subunit